MCQINDYLEGGQDREDDKDPKPNASTDYMRGYCDTDDMMGEGDE